MIDLDILLKDWRDNCLNEKSLKLLDEKFFTE
jgi:hypothetical protein